MVTLMKDRRVPAVGELLAERYALRRVIGRGLHSTVFEARDLRLGRDVAIKLLRHQRGDDADVESQRFAQEARTLAALSHPHIITIHDFVESEELVYLVLETASFGTLQRELSLRPLSPQRTLELLLPVMGALAFVHDHGLIHRDIKPENIALELRAGGACRAKLLDFGVARTHASVTPLGVITGTPAYMAPEQVSEGVLGPHTDVWGMGVVLYRCIAGRLPFESGDMMALMRRILTERAPRLSSVEPSAPPVLAAAIDRALAPGVEARYADMRAFAESIAAACVQDGIPLPTHPDPIGLPCFSDWLLEVDNRLTEPAPAPSPRPPEPPAPPPVAPATLRSTLRVVAQATALWTAALSLLGLLSLFCARSLLATRPPASPVPAQVPCTPAQPTFDVAEALAELRPPRTVCALPAPTQASDVTNPDALTRFDAEDTP